jgi:hypothetical protein
MHGSNASMADATRPLGYEVSLSIPHPETTQKRRTSWKSVAEFE